MGRNETTKKVESRIKKKKKKRIYPLAVAASLLVEKETSLSFAAVAVAVAAVRRKKRNWGKADRIGQTKPHLMQHKTHYSIPIH